MKFVVNNFESIPNFFNAIMHLQTMQDSPRLFYVVYWYTRCIVHVYGNYKILLSKINQLYCKSS